MSQPPEERPAAWGPLPPPPGLPTPGLPQPAGRPGPGTGPDAYGGQDPRWGPGSRWGPGAWQPPAVKPGIVPLRPLGVGEVLDGAIGAIRTNPRTMLGLSAVVVVAVNAVQFLAVWLLAGDLATAAQLPSDASARDVLVQVGDTAALLLATLIFQWLATTILGGVLSFAVGRAVLGRSPTVGEAWAAVRPVAGRLLGLPLVIGLALLAPIGLATALITLLALAGAPAAVTVLVAVVAVLGLVPALVWLYVRWALAPPVLVLESAGGASRVGILAAMARSAALVRGAWWRTFGLLLLVTVIATVVAGVVSAPFQLGSVAVPGGDAGLPALLLQSLGGLVGALLVIPFQAAALTLIYIDRRIRREGLDIELARAAGVELPGRTGPDPAAPAGPGRPGW